jgi:hypothetical protein
MGYMIIDHVVESLHFALMAGELAPYVKRPSDDDVKKADDVLQGYRVEERNFNADCNLLEGFEVSESSIKAIEDWAAVKQMDKAAISQLKASLKLMFHSDKSKEKLHFNMMKSDGFVVAKLVLACKTSSEGKKDIIICFGCAHFRDTEPWYSKAYKAIIGGESGIADVEFRNAVDVTCRKIMADTISSQR